VIDKACVERDFVPGQSAIGALHAALKAYGLMVGGGYDRSRQGEPNERGDYKWSFT
jgi:hypothetical protein